MLGGGVMQTPGLMGRVRAHAARIGNGFFYASADYETLLVEPGLGTRSGLLARLRWQWRPGLGTRDGKRYSCATI